MTIINHIQDAELELQNTLGIAIKAVRMESAGLATLKPIKIKKGNCFLYNLGFRVACSDGRWQFIYLSYAIIN